MRDLRQFLSAQGFFALTFSKIKTGHLLLNMQVNGVNGLFILDTGAGGTVIDFIAAQKFKIHASEQSDEKAAGAGGANLDVQISNSNLVQLGAIQLKDFKIMLMNLEHVNNAFRSKDETEVDGVIGADILEMHEAIIDYNGKMLFLKS